MTDNLKPNDIVLLVTGKEIPIDGGLIVEPSPNGRVVVTNEGDSLFKAYNIHTRKPIIVYGDNGQSDTWTINKTSGYIQLEADGKFHLHVKHLGDNPKIPIQANPEHGNRYGLPFMFPQEYIDALKHKSFGNTSSIKDGQSIDNHPLVVKLMQLVASTSLPPASVQVVINHISEKENTLNHSIS